MYGLRMAGVWSDAWYIDFAGEMIAQVTGGNYNWSENDANYLHLNQKATLVKNFDGKDYAQHESQETKEYGFSFTFADRYGAGFDCLVNEYAEKKADLMHMGLTETFVLNITYTDIYGQIRFLHLPVIIGATYWAYANGITDPVLGLGQQGGSLAYAGVLPDCAEITEITCTLGGEASYKAGDIKEVAYAGNSSLKTRRSTRYEASKTDDVRLISAAIYNMNRADILPVMSGALLEYDIKGKPDLYQLATNTEGDVLAADATTKLSLRAYDDKDLTVLNNNEYYMIEMGTDDMSAAGTESDIDLVLRYTDLAGRERESSDISVREATREYYGYWPASVTDLGYKLGTASGSSVKFIVSLRDVDHFTGLTIRLADGAKDDYQFKNITIYALTGFSGRKAVWRDVSKNGMNSYVDILLQSESGAWRNRR